MLSFGTVLTHMTLMYLWLYESLWRKNEGTFILLIQNAYQSTLLGIYVGYTYTQVSFVLRALGLRTFAATECANLYIFLT
jgi:branched-subunit amino acid transport protein AzlD